MGSAAFPLVAGLTALANESHVSFARQLTLGLSLSLVSKGLSRGRVLCTEAGEPSPDVSVYREKCQKDREPPWLGDLLTWGHQPEGRSSEKPHMCLGKSAQSLPFLLEEANSPCLQGGESVGCQDPEHLLLLSCRSRILGCAGRAGAAGSPMGN